MSTPLLLSIGELKKIESSFLQELQNAASGQKNSIVYIKNCLPKHSLVQNNEVFQVITIGGSVLTSSLVFIDDKTIHIKSHERIRLPQMQTREIFFELVLKYVKPEIKLLSLNFAYYLDPITNSDRALDGVFIAGAKEHTFNGLFKKTVGEEFKKYYHSKTNKHITVTAANDAVCLTLAGLQTDTGEHLVGMVIGTGFNAAFFQDTNTIINLEAGRFNIFTRTESGKFVDEHSLLPNDHVFEKEFSGGYLYQHYNYICKKMGIDSKLQSSIELSSIASSNTGPRSEIAQRLIERSASFISCVTSALWKFKNTNLTIIVEGNLYLGGWHYREFVDLGLVKLGVPEKSIRFVYLKHSSTIGAGYLATTGN